MYRNSLAVALLLGATASVLAVDRVHYQARVATKYQEYVTKKGDAIEGKIEKESPAGIEIKTKAGKTVTIPPSEVLAVEYDVSKGLVLEFRSPLFKLETAKTKATPEERIKAYNAELDNFQKLRKAVEGYPDARGYVEFKIAETMALIAEEDPAKRGEAIKALNTFAENNSRRWTIMPALTTLAKLQETAGQTEGALATYKKLAAVVPKELKLETDLLVGRLLLRTAKYKDAEDQFGGLLEKLSDDNPEKPLVRAYLADAKINQNNLTGVDKELQGLINSTSDARLRGVAYNLLGDLHYKAGKHEDAFWAYLRVDALYNEDADEHAKALYHLADLFTKIKKTDPGRADDCARRLRDKRFATSPYQKRLIAEKGDPDKEETKKEEKKDKDAKKDK